MQESQSSKCLIGIGDGARYIARFVHETGFILRATLL